jgi:hypothetical protein
MKEKVTEKVIKGKRERLNEKERVSGRESEKGEIASEKERVKK